MFPAAFFSPSSHGVVRVMKRYAALTPLAALTLSLAGCGGPTEVHGVLKMDGNPVEGATVTFVTEDGNKSFSGQTDAGGNFTLSGPRGPGAERGNYKVVVVKSPKIPGAETMQPGSPEYQKQVEKMAEKKGPGSRPGFPGAPAPTLGPPGGVASELPSVYASAATTPLTAKIPPDQNPLVIEIKAKP